MTAATAPAARPARRQVLPNGVLGMLVFVFTEIMLFAGMISAHAISRAGASEWPPANQPRLPVVLTLGNTVALLISGAMLIWAQRSWRRSPAAVKPPLFGALALGIFFVAAQGREWIGLIREGLTLTSSNYGGFFYLIVGAHALHALVAILALGWVWRRLVTGRLAEAQLATVAVFWYFV
ncbi:MAG: cytochrome c oxidase subunit 3, partial [Gemmatimonadota bacterium]|nr:cytochrome c oxidase subunit 3 [Gemmatimonadota bacterium]